MIAPHPSKYTKLPDINSIVASNKDVGSFNRSSLVGITCTIRPVSEKVIVLVVLNSPIYSPVVLYTTNVLGPDSDSS